MTDRDKSKRPPTIAGDDERVAAGSKYRRPQSQPGEGVVAGEVAEEDSMAVIVGDDDTPVEIPAATGAARRRARRTIQEFADETKAEIRALRAELVTIRGEILANHIANADRVSEAISKASNVEHQVKTMCDLGESVDALVKLGEIDTELTKFRAELTGANGDNGRIGTLRADMEREVAEIRSDVWGDEVRKKGDQPVIKEARRGIWILRTLAAMAIGVAGTAGYIVKGAIHQDGEVEAQILDDRAEIRSLRDQVQLLYSKLLIPMPLQPGAPK